MNEMIRKIRYLYWYLARLAQVLTRHLLWPGQVQYDLSKHCNKRNLKNWPKNIVKSCLTPSQKVQKSNVAYLDKHIFFPQKLGIFLRRLGWNALKKYYKLALKTKKCQIYHNNDFRARQAFLHIVSRILLHCTSHLKNRSTSFICGT